MALIWLEGFEGYNNNTDMLQQSAMPCKWMNFYNTSGALNSTTYRTAQVTSANSRSYYISVASDWWMSMATVPNSTELIFGFAFYKNSGGNFYGSLAMFGGSTVEGQGVVLGLDNTNRLFCSTPNASSGGPNAWLGSTATGVISSFTWHYIEVRAKLGTTTGQFEVKVDGVQVLNLNNINTATGSITSYGVVGIGGVVNNYFYGLYDDMYLVDTTGTTNNTFLGPISVYSLMPTANGSSTQFTPSAGSNWDCVNDGVNNTTDYVSTAVTGNKDYYTFEALPGSVTAVSGVLLKARSTLPSTGTRKIKLNLKNGASVISSALKALVMGTWLQHGYVSDTAPDGSAWDPAKVNSTEGGIEAG